MTDATAVLASWAILLGLLLPGIALTLALSGPRQPTAAALVTGAGVGQAVVFCLVYLAGAVDLAYATPAVLAYVLSGVGAGLWWWRRSRGRWSWQAVGAVPKAAGLCFLLYIAVRLVPVVLQPLPRGWDPYFHLVLIDRIAETGRLVHDWRPYEPIDSLHYPVGTHVLLAWLVRITGGSAPAVFSVGIAFFTALLAAQLFGFLRRASGRDDLALYGALTFAFVTGYGSLDYALWGGLPNVAALSLLVALLSLLTAPADDGPPRRALGARALAGGVLIVALSLAHHHVMLTALWLGAGALVVALWRRDRERVRLLLAVAVAGAVLGAPYFIAYARQAGQLGETQVWRYIEPVLTPGAIAESLGLVATAACCLGALLVARRRAPAPGPAILEPLALLLILFVALEYGVRGLTAALAGRAMAPFTPSRLLTDAVPLLAGYAGSFFVWLAERRRYRQSTMVLVILALGLTQWTRYGELLSSPVSAPRLDAYAYIRDHTPADALIIEQACETTALTQRSSALMPVPSSESQDASGKAAAVKATLAGRPPAAWAARPLLVLAPAASLAELGLPGTVLWRHASGLTLLALPWGRRVE